MTTLDFLCLQAAAGAYGKPLPSCWLDWNDAEQMEWLAANASERIEYVGAENFMAKVQAHADTIKSTFQTVIATMQHNLVTAISNQTLPSDLRHLDLAALANRPIPTDTTAWQSLAERGVGEHDLDALVHDIASDEATRINNGGLPAQVGYLLRRGLDVSLIWEEAKEANPELRD